MNYTLEIVLRDYKPKNWRKIKISSDVTFERLCNEILPLYGLEKDHLWEFRYGDDIFINSPEFGDIDNNNNLDLEDKEFDDLQWVSVNHNGGRYRLEEYFEDNKEVSLFYDFGDNWVFDIKIIEKWDEDILDNTEIIWWDGYYLISGIGGVEWLDELLQEYKKKAINPDLFESWEDFEDYIKPALTKWDADNHK